MAKRKKSKKAAAKKAGPKKAPKKAPAKKGAAKKAPKKASNRNRPKAPKVEKSMPKSTDTHGRVATLVRATPERLEAFRAALRDDGFTTTQQWFDAVLEEWIGPA